MRNVVINFKLKLAVAVISRLLLASALVAPAFVLALSPTGVAYAQEGGPGGGGAGGGAAGGGGSGCPTEGKPIVDVFVTIGKIFLQIIFGISGVVFAASVARGGMSAQLANLVGSPNGMSQAWLNIIAAIFTFIITMMAMVVVGVVFDAVAATASCNIPVFGA